MMGKTHTIAGACFGALGLIVAHQTDPILAASALACSTAGGLMPDIDHPQASLARRNLFFGSISRLCAKVSRHRRFWHTPIAIVAMAAGFFLILSFLNVTVLEWCLNLMGSFAGLEIPRISVGKIGILTLFFFFGELSHLVADSFNPEGVPWLWPLFPLEKKFHVPLISVTTNTPMETMYRMFFTCMTVIFLYLWATKVVGFIPDFVPEIIAKMGGQA